jgi:hypothetical protein
MRVPPMARCWWPSIAELWLRVVERGIVRSQASARRAIYALPVGFVESVAPASSAAPHRRPPGGLEPDKQAASAYVRLCAAMNGYRSEARQPLLSSGG